jgi:hypothetical protein
MWIKSNRGFICLRNQGCGQSGFGHGFGYILKILKKDFKDKDFKGIFYTLFIKSILKYLSKIVESNLYYRYLTKVTKHYIFPLFFLPFLAPGSGFQVWIQIYKNVEPDPQSTREAFQVPVGTSYFSK